MVRDKIPGIIIEKGNFPRTRILDGKEYSQSLEIKLREEIDEYIESGEIQELADIVEVIRAILKDKGHDMKHLEKLRADKANERGGFDKRIYLEGIDE